MSIQKEHGHYFDSYYLLECDICQNNAEEEFNSFFDAQYFAKDNCWKRKYEGGGWIDICPECQE